MRLRRRTVLAGAGGLLATTSGCSIGGPGSRPDVTLVLRNYTSEPQPLQVEILRDDGSGGSDARVLRREFEVPRPSAGETAGVVREQDLLPSGRYIVRVLLKFGRGDWEHHHFVPLSSGAGEIDIGIHREDASGELYTRFR